jgi:uncharacterized membrane protein
MVQIRRPIHDEVERIVYFSDAVFAIALTLLAINLRLPASNDSVADLLRQMRPAFFSFFVSFLVIGVMWMAHHRMFTFIARNDGALMTVNLVLLLTVTLIPFTSSVLGDRPNDVGAIVLYASSIAAMSFASGCVWLVALVRHLLAADADRALTSYFLGRTFSITVVFLVSIPVALFISGDAATYVWFAAIAIRIALRAVYRASPALFRQAGVPETPG